MKHCNTCLEEKELSEFSPKKNGYLGRNSDCKKCCAIKAKQYRKKNHEKVLILKRAYAEKNRDKINEQNRNRRKDPIIREKCRLYAKKRYEKNPFYTKEVYQRNPEYRKKRNIASKEWKLKNKHSALANNINQKIRYPEKVRARNILRCAVYSKRICKPNICENCMKEFNRIEGHHDDYSKPLEVKWLCVTCHKELHRIKKEA